MLLLFRSSEKQFPGDLVIAKKLKMDTPKTTISACPKRFTMKPTVSLKIKRQKERFWGFAVVIDQMLINFGHISKCKLNLADRETVRDGSYDSCDRVEC